MVACLARVRSANRWPVGQGELDGFSSAAGSGSGSGAAGTRALRQWRCWGDGPFGGLAQVVPEVPPVRDLDGLRGAGGGTFGEERRPVPAYDLNARPVGEPGRQAGCLPVGQQVDGTVGLDVDEDGAVMAALAGGVLVNADHTRGSDLGLGERIDQPEHRTAAHGHSEDAGYAGSGPARESQTDRGQGRAQLLGPLTVSACQAGYLLDEGKACAPRVPTGEPTDPQLENNASSTARNISGKPQVRTMNLVRPDPAGRAHGALRGASRVDAYHLDVHVHRQHRDIRDRREQQLLQPELDVFHGPELSAQSPRPRVVFGRLCVRPDKLSYDSAWWRHRSCARTLLVAAFIDEFGQRLVLQCDFAILLRTQRGTGTATA